MRIRALLGQTGAPELWVSTLHTLGLRILREEFAAIGSAEYTSPTQQLAARCYADYCDTFGTFNAVDFDDLITLPLHRFQDRPDVLDRWRARIRYLLVDEYQDTNLAQYELVKLLAGDGGGFAAVASSRMTILGSANSTRAMARR